MRLKYTPDIARFFVFCLKGALYLLTVPARFTREKRNAVRTLLRNCDPDARQDRVNGGKCALLGREKIRKMTTRESPKRPRRKFEQTLSESC